MEAVTALLVTIRQLEENERKDESATVTDADRDPLNIAAPGRAAMAILMFIHPAAAIGTANVRTDTQADVTASETGTAATAATVATVATVAIVATVATVSTVDENAARKMIADTPAETETRMTTVVAPAATETETMIPTMVPAIADAAHRPLPRSVSPLPI